MRKALFKIGRIEVWMFNSFPAPLVEYQRWAWWEGTYLHKLFLHVTPHWVLAISWYFGRWK